MFIKRCFHVACLTSLYYIDEIYVSSRTLVHFFLAYLVQALHDWVCLYFVCIYVYAFQKKTFYIQLNSLYTLIMFLFSVYKRCVLTLVYNYILGLPMCTRYIPLWQRLVHMTSRTLCVEDDRYKTTYLWLNDHIFQSCMMILVNVYWLYHDSTKSVKST
jgi:hypothetical protein